MASTFTDELLGLELQSTGDNEGTWGTKLNENLSVISRAIGGYLTKIVAGSSNVTLTQTESEYAVLELTGALTGNIEVRPVSAEKKVWLVFNNTTGDFTLTFVPSGASGVVIPQGHRKLVYSNGTNVLEALTYKDLTLSSADAGATGGPDLILDRDSASPAASDVLGRLIFRGEDSAGNDDDYAQLQAVVVDPTSTSEDGALQFQTALKVRTSSSLPAWLIVMPTVRFALASTDKEADTFGSFSKASAANGGLRIDGWGANSPGIQAFGMAGAEDTTDTTGSAGAIILAGRLKSGTTTGDLGSTGNVLAVRNNSTTHFLVKGNGDIHGSDTTGATALDHWDDAALCRAFDLELADPATVIRTRFDDFVKYDRAALTRAGILGRISPEQEARGERPLINLSQLWRLHNGAIWQLHSKLMEQGEALAELTGIQRQLVSERRLGGGA